MKKSVVFILFLLLLNLNVIADEETKTFRENLITNFRPSYEANTAAYSLAGILVLIILVYSWLKWTKLKKNKKKSGLWVILLMRIAGAIILTYLLYAAYVYWYSGVSTEGLEICDGDECRLSVHWHATLEELSVCGETVERPWEEGDLGEQHTHKDNRMHFHSTLHTDPNTGDILDKERLSFGLFFDELGWKFSEDCFKDKCDCNGERAFTKVWVNGEEAEDIRNYVLSDGDKVIIRYG